MPAFRIERPVTAFSVSPSKGRRRPREMADGHLRFIRSLPCCVCGARTKVQAAHVRMGSPAWGKRSAGIGEKPDDRWTVPLCQHDHLDGPEAQHRVGEEAFWSRHGIDPFQLASALWGATGDEEVGEQIIRQARARVEEVARG